ncbi:MAG TPA: DUF3866 family protein [Bacillota bacterium]|nr:DUF3866 family protein [Bacillota bacterium]
MERKGFRSSELRMARVLQVTGEWPGVSLLGVELDGSPGRSEAVAYPELTGQIAPGDRVLLNTTAVSLGLGTGGYHFVVAVEGRERRDEEGPGHIMKLRYTPVQFRCHAVEEEGHPARDALDATSDLAGMVVVAGCVHSQLPPILAGLRAALDPPPRVAYLMTEGGALPLAFSRLAGELRERGWLAGTITAGHAFGGDYEAVNQYTGLLAARAALRADFVVAAMGPGGVGTGTRWGFTAIEQGEIVDRVNRLGGRPVAALRVSFADPRPRHQGVSHHCLTSLGRVAATRAVVAVPRLPPSAGEVLYRQLAAAGVSDRHEVVEEAGEPALACLEREGMIVRTMGRAPAQDREFFLAAGAAGAAAARLAGKGGKGTGGQSGVPGQTADR